MSKVSTVSESKGMKPRGPAKRDIPKEGTKIRELYDLFMNNKGKVLDVVLGSGNHHSKEYLMDFYGLDIRCLRYGKWCLVGEWDGDKYIDYVTQMNE